MDGATLQARIDTGYAKAAVRIGKQFSLYRPASLTKPLASVLATVTAAFDAKPNFKFAAPNEYGHPTWYALLSASVQVGDYLINASDTFLIVARQPLLPVLAVSCNRIASLYQPDNRTGVGAVGYGGTTASNRTTVLTGWPCSILQGTKGEKSDVALPGDTRTPWWSILLPLCLGITIHNNDIITDDLGRTYIVSSAEQTDLGWRITAMQSLT